MSPVFLNEYQAREEYYTDWLKANSGNVPLPESKEQRLDMLINKRLEAYQKLCDVVYEEKGFTSEGIPKRETVIKFDLLDQQAGELLKKYGV